MSRHVIHILTTGALVLQLTGCVASGRLYASVPSVTPRPKSSETENYIFCKEMSDAANEASSLNSVIGWGLVIPAAGSVALAGVVGTDPAQKTFVRRNPGLMMSVGGALIGALGYYYLTRSSDAAKVAADSTTAHSQPAILAYDACIASKAAWLNSRASAQNDAMAVLKKTAEEAYAKEKAEALAKADALTKEKEALAQERADMESARKLLREHMLKLGMDPAVIPPVSTSATTPGG